MAFLHTRRNGYITMSAILKTKYNSLHYKHNDYYVMGQSLDTVGVSTPGHSQRNAQWTWSSSRPETRTGE
jgi:hypothetical protein